VTLCQWLLASAQALALDGVQLFQEMLVRAYQAGEK